MESCRGVWNARGGGFNDGNFLLCAPSESFVIRVEPVRGKTLFVLPLGSTAPLNLNGSQIPPQGFGVFSANAPLVLHSKEAGSFLLGWISRPLRDVAKFSGPLVVRGGPEYASLAPTLNDAETASEVGAILKKLEARTAEALAEGNPVAYQELPLRLRNRIALVQSLWDHFAAKIDSDIDLPEIASRNGISQRTLEYAFQEIVGTTPVGFIKILRLHRARRLILNGEVRTVKDASARCGMWHFGRFSIEYRAQFGKHPRQSLQGVKIPSDQARAA